MSQGVIFPAMTNSQTYTVPVVGLCEVYTLCTEPTRSLFFASACVHVGNPCHVAATDYGSDFYFSVGLTFLFSPVFFVSGWLQLWNFIKCITTPPPPPGREHVFWDGAAWTLTRLIHWWSFRASGRWKIYLWMVGSPWRRNSWKFVLRLVETIYLFKSRLTWDRSLRESTNWAYFFLELFQYPGDIKK